MENDTTSSGAPMSHHRSLWFMFAALSSVAIGSISGTMSGCGSDIESPQLCETTAESSASAGGMGGAGGIGGAVMSEFMPVLQVDTNGVKIIQGVKIDANLVIIEDHDGTLKDLATRPHAFDGPIGIEIRGNTSAGFPKKSYGLETRDDLGMDLDQSLLGMPQESDWVLHGPYSDKTLMRNKLTYDLGRALGHYAPRTRFVELFVNNQYQGVYVFLEKIKRNVARVNIPKVADTAALGDITGGYILKLEDGFADGGFFSAAGTAWQYHYPRPDTITSEQSAYIQGYINQFETVMFGPLFSHPGKGYKSLIDIPSFVDFAIITELSHNVDGYRKSTYMYKDSDANGGLVYMGPLWDFDIAYGNVDYCDGFRTDNFVYMGGICKVIGEHIPKWWLKLMADPDFTKALGCRWGSLRKGVLSDASLMQRIDSYRDEVKFGEPRDHAAWGNIGVDVWPNNFIGANYDEEITYLKQWIQKRTAWLDLNLKCTC